MERGNDIEQFCCVKKNWLKTVHIKTTKAKKEKKNFTAFTEQIDLIFT